MGMAFHFARNLTCLMLAVWAVFLSAEAIGLSQNAEKPMLLSGMVVDQVGAVVANLTIEIYPRPANSAAQPEKQTAVIPARTDQQGQFSASLLPGVYEVCVPLSEELPLD